MTHSCPTLRSADLQDCQYARSLHARAGAAQMQQRAGKACRPLAPRAWKRLQERGGTGYRTVRVRAGTEDANGAAHMTILSIRIVGRRSAEHTSELQSLMRTSYAVFRLKIKKST